MVEAVTYFVKCVCMHNHSYAERSSLLNRFEMTGNDDEDAQIDEDIDDPNMKTFWQFQPDFCSFLF